MYDIIYIKNCFDFKPAHDFDGFRFLRNIGIIFVKLKRVLFIAKNYHRRRICDVVLCVKKYKEWQCFGIPSFYLIPQSQLLSIARVL